MRAIQRHLPNPRLFELDRMRVAAPADAAWAAARHFDGASIPWVRWLFGLREIRWAPMRPVSSRASARGEPRRSEWIQAGLLFPPVHALMQHVQLTTLKRLAERQALARSCP